MPNTFENSSTITPPITPTINPGNLATATGGVAKQPPWLPPPCHTVPAPRQPPSHGGWPFGNWGHGAPSFQFPSYHGWNHAPTYQTLAGPTQPAR